MDYPLDVIVHHTQQRICCSILPLEGKRPAQVLTTWKQFRNRRPTPEQIEHWFVMKRLQAYGIILGRSANGLFVIDFDDPVVYERTRENHAKINNTYTVKTRRGYHVYLRIERRQATRKFIGGDIKGEGSYVVGAGSTVEDYQYIEHRSTEIQQLTETELRKIEQELGVQNSTTIKAQKQRETSTQVIESLQTQYKNKALQLGRNNALYQTARTACQGGIPETATRQALITLHTKTKTKKEHKRESKKSRQREAKLTIQSAYRTKTKNKAEQSNQGAIPNSIREQLLQETNSTAPGRFLEKLLRSQNKENQKITKTEAYEIGKQLHISNRDIRKTLETRINGTKIFKEIKKPSHSHNTSPYARERDSLNSKSLPTRGRPIHIVYEIPTIESLCQLFNVITQSSDPLSTEDLSSAKAYRKALHRELIKRRSPEQSIRWHAERLGISKRTVRRYNHELGVIRTPIIEYVPITHTNVDYPSHYGTPIDKSGFTPGKWLQRRDGKRYPALKGIALSQLRNTERLIACHQRPSKLQLPIVDQPLILHDLLWRRTDRPDQDDWGGKATGFPPVDPPPKQYKPIISLTSYQQGQPVSLTIESLTVDCDSQLPTHDYHVSPQINNKLTLIRGIGERRADRLYDVGISTMTQLIAAGAEKIAAIGWAGGYVTDRTTAQWVTEAQQLLGLRQDTTESDAVIALKNRQKRAKLFRQHLRSYHTYLEKLIDWEDDIFGTRNSKTLGWHRELSWVKFQFEHNWEYGIYLPQEQERYRKRINQFISDYIARIDTFIAMGNTKLDKLSFGTIKGWRSLRRRSLTQQQYFDKQENKTS